MSRHHFLRAATLAPALFMAISVVPASAANITVDGTNCSLSDAIVSANTDSAQSGCVAGSGADTLILDADVNLSASDTTGSTQIAGTYAGLPDVISAITIRAGSGSVIRRSNGNICTVPTDAANEFRLINVTGAGAGLTLEGVRLENGCANEGGGVHVSDGASLTVVDSAFEGNSAFERGGAIRTEGSG